ncbi:ATP-binding protein [Streptosporangium lutulentum]|uniref:ATP/maltotriose-dependent transcriptional regulator MalT n=1 Tax=Streptosporangium lutulentum TaxID=1461250 RepID=A0ABT9QJU5_9ACTN|nr:AAA family ATPase [Streptosporangium lutulentum]MDP9847032.1 ATP/maltotriose-dependent transcriptional regulator MalT [Streptosporangium lutulentum]
MEDGVFVGRARELADLERRVAAAREGGGALVLVEGEAGAGKTALAHSVARSARRAGVRAAWGSCREGEGAPAYQPWVQILRGLGRSSTVLLDPAVTETGSRFHVFEDVVGMLHDAAGDAGLLLILDDLHWADVPSIRLLQAVTSTVADSRLLVIGLCRTRDASSHAGPAEALRPLTRERAVTRLSLGGLAPAEVAELAARVLGRRPEPALLRTVDERAEGNPLFVLELLRLVETIGSLDPGLPGGVRHVVGRRLDGLPPETRRLLRHAAVLGREFTGEAVGALVGEEIEDVLDLLDPALAANVIRADGHSLRFTHVLTQEVLYAELPTVARRRLHAQAADVVRSTSAGEIPVDALAYHLRQSAPLGNAEEALRATRTAATRARAQLAYEHAAFQYRAALDLLTLVPYGAAQRPELLLELARCEFRSGAVEEAWRSCQAAADLGRATGGGAVVADAATVLRGISNSPVTAAIHVLCREALTMLGGSDEVREAKALAQLVITADPFAERGESDLGLRALRMAEATGDADARFLAMQARYTELVDGRHVLERLSIGERAIRLASETGHHEYAAWGHTWRLEAFWALGRRVQLDAELKAFGVVVAQLREPLWQWRLTLTRAAVALLEGRFEQARLLSDEALAIGLRAGHEGAEFVHLVFLAHMGLQDGAGLDQAEAAVRGFVETGPYLARSWHALVLAGMGRLDDAAALWEAITPHLAAFPRDAPEWIVSGAGNAQLCVAFDDRVTAAAVYEALLPYADRQVASGAHTPSSGPVSLYLGMLATLLRRWEAAGEHLHAALASCQAMGSAPYEAYTRLELARLLRLRPPSGTGAAADEHLDGAMRIARRVGMPSLLAHAETLHEARGRAGVLTPREEQVAELVAEGLSNRQIAHRLRMAERTAENHVTHILTKLGFDSRARVAAWYTARRHPG